MRQNSAKLCHLLQKDAVSPPLCHQAAFQESAQLQGRHIMSNSGFMLANCNNFCSF